MPRGSYGTRQHSNARGSYGPARLGTTGRGVYGNAQLGQLYGGALGALRGHEEAVQQMQTEWQAIFQAVGRQSGFLPTAGSGRRVEEVRARRPDWVNYWTDVIEPFNAEWQVFKQEQIGGSDWKERYIRFGNRWSTMWSTYENWKKRIAAVRDGAERLGFKISAPPVAPLPTTIFEDVLEGGKTVIRETGSAIQETGRIVKYAVIGGLVIGGALVISSLVANVRKGRDPVEQYAGFLRGGRRGQRALPAGAE